MSSGLLVSRLRGLIVDIVESEEHSPLRSQCSGLGKLRMSVAPDGKSTLVAAPIFTTPNKNLGDESYLVTVGYHCAPLPPPPTHPPKLTDDAAHVGMQIASCSRRRARWSTLPSTGCAAPGSKVGRTDILGPCRVGASLWALSVSRLRTSWVHARCVGSGVVGKAVVREYVCRVCGLTRYRVYS